MQATKPRYNIQSGRLARCFTQRISKMMHNSLIDNSADILSMQTYLKRCILAEDIDKIQIATGYWDIPGMSLVIDELTSFLSRESTSLELLIGKDHYVYASLLANPKYKDANYPYDFIRTDIHKIEIIEKYKSVINLLLTYCESGKFRYVFIRRMSTTRRSFYIPNAIYSLGPRILLES